MAFEPAIPSRDCPPPSGEQIVLAHRDQRAVVVEVGGGLRQYTAGGVSVLDGYAQHERCTSGRGQILAPWPNRLRDGRYDWAGERHQLALSEAPLQNAIHGLVRWANWTVAERSPEHVVMAHTLYPQDGYPFTLALKVAHTLDDGGLTVETTATNLGPVACPYGVGAHPYLTVGGGSVGGAAIDDAGQTIGDWALQVPASVWLRSDERSIPIGPVRVEGTEYDLRSPRPIGQLRLDTCFGGLSRGADGHARVTLEAPSGGRRVTVWLDDHHPYVMVFTGDSLTDVDRRRRSVAIEPMTCAPNAFQSGAGLRTLQPGESFTSSWGIQPG